MNWFVFICLALIFLITPFQEGLYFNADYYPINLILFIIFLVFIIRQLTRNEIHLIKRYLIVLLLPLSYLLSLPFADSPKGAWDSVLKWVFYSSFFILLIWSASKPKIKELLPHLFQLSGACIALSMIFHYYGWIDYPNAIVGGRFGGIFQYPNTFGVVMALFFFYSLAHATEEKIAAKKLFLQISLSLIYCICLIQSSSRGIMMFFPLIWLIGLLLLPVKKQMRYLIYSFVSILSALIVYQSMIKEQSGGNHYPGLFLLVVMILVSNAIIFFINRIWGENSFSFRIKKGSHIVLPLVMIVVLGLGFLDIRYHGLVYHQLPAALQDRIGSIDLSTATAKDRLTFFKDALTMSKFSPIIGFGGGGWEVLYNNYQSFPYISNKIHNGYMQWIIETGWFGFFLFLIVFVYFFYLLMRSYITEKDSPSKLAVILALLAIFIHSFIDFNFSFGTVWLLIFWLFAMGLPDLPVEKQVEKLKKQATKQAIKIVNRYWKYKAILIAYAIVLIIGVIQSYRFITAEQYAAKAKATNDIRLKQQLLQKAVAGDPNNITYMLNLADIYLAQYQQSNDVDFKKKAEQLVDNMGKMEPRNSTVLTQNAHLSELLGNENAALMYFNQALNADHFNASLYQDSITLKVNLAIEYRNRHNTEKSNDLLNSAIMNFQQEELGYQKLDRSKARNRRYNNRDFHITESTQYYTALAYFIKKDYSQVVKITGEPKKGIGDNLLALRILANDKLGLKNETGYRVKLEGNLENLRKLLQNK